MSELLARRLFGWARAPGAPRVGGRVRCGPACFRRRRRPGRARGAAPARWSRPGQGRAVSDKNGKTCRPWTSPRGLPRAAPLRPAPASVWSRLPWRDPGALAAASPAWQSSGARAGGGPGPPPAAGPCPARPLAPRFCRAGPRPAGAGILGPSGAWGMELGSLHRPARRPQVLEDVCLQQEFSPSEYDLKFQRNVLDLSVQWRFANLPNHAKLEMVPVSRSREGSESVVRVALQLEDGSRLQDTFSAAQTLWELLCHFPQTRERLEQPCGATPICVHMRDEVAGRAALQHRTLRSLGLTGGSAVIRFAMKCCDPTAMQGPRGTGTASPGSPGPAPPAPRELSPPLPPGSAEHSHGDGGQEEAAGPTNDPTELLEPAAPIFIPFSGGGHRLGQPPGPSRPLTAPTPAATPQKPFSSPGGPSRPKKSKPGQETLQESELPVDRSPVVCHPDLEERTPAWPAELPDDFFEVTVDDVRRRLAQLESERKRLEDAPLVTQAFREAQAQAKLERYPKVALRVLFPDRYILQGFFRPSETVGDLRTFVKSHLRRPSLPFYLFIAPPKTLLDDSLTFFQANLFPTALIHFGAETPQGEDPASGPPTGLYLEPTLLAHTVAPSAADELVARYMARATKVPALPPAAPPESEPALEEGPVPLPGPVPCQPVRRDLGKVPKWLKLPASKR